MSLEIVQETNILRLVVAKLVWFSYIMRKSLYLLPYKELIKSSFSRREKAGIFHFAIKHRLVRKRVVFGTWMVLTAGLLSLFKCFFTSSFWFEAPYLAAQDSETVPNSHKHTKKLLFNFTRLKCTAAMSQNSPETSTHTLRRCSNKTMINCSVRGKGVSGFLLVAKIQPQLQKS